MAAEQCSERHGPWRSGAAVRMLRLGAERRVAFSPGERFHVRPPRACARCNHSRGRSTAGPRRCCNRQQPGLRDQSMGHARGDVLSGPLVRGGGGGLCRAGGRSSRRRHGPRLTVLTGRCTEVMQSLSAINLDNLDSGRRACGVGLSIVHRCGLLRGTGAMRRPAYKERILHVFTS